MNKQILIAGCAALGLAASGLAAAQTSSGSGGSSSGSSGSSGSAGLGIDYGALIPASNPTASLPTSETQLGGPIAGLRDHFSKIERSRR